MLYACLHALADMQTAPDAVQGVDSGSVLVANGTVTDPPIAFLNRTIQARQHSLVAIGR